VKRSASRVPRIARHAARGAAVVMLGASLVTAAPVWGADGDPDAPPPENTSLTWKGITLYGVVDLGLQYQTHGVTSSDYVAYSTEPVVQKNSNGSVTALVSSPLSWSRIGLSGKEPLVGDWSGVFRLETYFNPTSGDLSDGLKSLTLNNGRANNAQTTNLDSSVAGEIFGGGAYVGLSSPTGGTLTFGRQLTLLAQGIVDYDPIEDGQDSAHAFSLLGGSRTAAGGGTTEDTRLDHSIKYTNQLGWIRLGALYQFSGASGDANTAIQGQLGIEVAGARIDAYFARKYDAISASALGSAQLKALSPAYSPSNALAATVSDNTAFAIMGRYRAGPVRVYTGYEHISFGNPSTPLADGFADIGGYVLADINNTAYANNKILQVYWAGAKWQVNSRFYVAGSYYGYHQSSYATNAFTGCSGTASSGCSGTETGIGVIGAYALTQRFETYLGSVWTHVADGLASGYLYDATVTSTVGVRFKF
jgi:predicted porin